MKKMKTDITCRLGRRPDKQGPRPQLRNRGWVEKCTTGTHKYGTTQESDRMVKEPLRPVKQELKIGTWNVQTLWSTGKLELLKQEVETYQCDILGIAEMRWTESGELNGEVIWSGESNNHVRGVGFLLRQRAINALIGYKPVNSRIIAARFRGMPMNITVIQVYAPTADSTEEDIEAFYEQLDETMKEIPKKDIKIVMGDWNAKVGQVNEGWEMAMGRYGFGDRNNRGERLLQFAVEHEMFVCNTRFQQKDSRKWTWISPDGKSRNMIDMVLIDRRWKTSVRNCRTYQGADISSDHSLVLCKIQVRLKRRQPRKDMLPRINIQAFRKKQIQEEFEHKLKIKLRDSNSRKPQNIDEKNKLAHQACNRDGE